MTPKLINCTTNNIQFRTPDGAIVEYPRAMPMAAKVHTHIETIASAEMGIPISQRFLDNDHAYTNLPDEREGVLLICSVVVAMEAWADGRKDIVTVTGRRNEQNIIEADTVYVSMFGGPDWME